VLTFLAPQFLWTLLAIPIVIILHFIRARKKRQDVSALFLWKQAKEQAETRRKFSPSWLLALQLAFVTFAALALAQPSMVLASRPDRILIVDTSASMAARDSDGIRLERAISAARQLLRGSGQVALLRASTDALVVQPLTSTISDVDAALGNLVAADEDGNLERAISLARSLSPQAEIHVFTDNSLPNSALAENSRVTLHAVTGDAVNLGISAFELGIQQLFVSLVSNNPRPQEVTLELYQNNNLVSQAPLLVAANGQANTSFPLQTTDGLFEVRFAVPEWDALSLDNSAFVGQRSLRIVSNTNDSALARAFSSLPNVDYQVLPNAALNAPGFDVRVVTGGLPEDTTQGNFILFAPATETPSYQFITDWDRGDPLFRFVDLADSSLGLTNPVLFNNPEWQTLARSSDLTPVILRYQKDKLNVIAFNFSPSQSELVNRSAFPLLIANIITSFRNENRLILGTPLAAGAVRLEGEKETSTSLADVPGLYRIDNTIYTASLLNAEESRLPTTVLSETTGETTTAQGSRRATPFAFWLILLALLFVLAEWLLWSRGRNGWTIFGRQQSKS
jgi:Aerotolerance regulator N-terminal/von Willebrand factor type A domain